ncbi:MAG: hypothetical protein OXI53_09995 [Nitrospira sp.]|nr:hypothetical protein [Nitrospira sp.]MDE0405629.1 hypothetical protein [Nitrospira sp.]MDE0486717.1 hypothetical protein [Nitrospira sp.]
MTTKEREMESLEVEFEKQEAGVADLMEFYEKVEKIYIQASASVSESEIVYSSDSTNMTRPNAYLGRDSN